MPYPSTQKFKDKQICKLKTSLVYKDLVSGREKRMCLLHFLSSVGKEDQI